MRTIFLAGLIVLLGLGFISYVESQSIITTTTTRIVTIPPTTYTTTTIVQGTTVVATVQMPGYTIIMEIREPSQTCTIVFRAQQPPTVMTIPATTIAVPGTTFSTVFTIREFATTMTEVTGGTTAMRTSFEPMPVVTYGYTVTMPLYGVITESCNAVTITEIIRYILDSAPATVRYSFEGITTTIPGTTITMQGLPTVDLQTTYTTVKPGTTYGMTSRVEGIFYTTTQIATPTTITRTIVSPGTTVTETFTTVITLQLTTPTPTTQTPTPTATPTQTQTLTTPSGFSVTELLIPVAAIVVVLAVVLMALRLRR